MTFQRSSKTQFKKYAICALVFLANPIFANEIERVSLSSTGEQSNENSFNAQITDDGRLVVFMSHATNFFEGDVGIDADIFLHNRDTGLTELLSVTSSGEQGIGYSQKPQISGAGRYVAFETQANNLLDIDNGTSRFKIALLDRETGMIEHASRSFFGISEPNHYSFDPSLSDDGRFVAYSSNASNIILNDTNGKSDIFVYDRVTQANERVSVTSGGLESTGFSTFPKISADGRIVVFRSDATDLVSNTAVGPISLYVHDRQTGMTDLIVTATTGTIANFYHFDLSADGRYVAFTTRSTDLAEADTDTTQDVQVYDRVTNEYSLASVSSTGVKGNSSSYYPTISGDGRYVLFSSQASNLTDYNFGSTGGKAYVHDRQTGITDIIVTSLTGQAGSSIFNEKDITPDGRYITLRSGSTNLVDGDTNRKDDVFVKNNPLTDPDNQTLIVEKPINNIPRVDSGSAAQLATGSMYREFYTVTNNTQHRLYQVKVYEGNTVVCDFFILEPGQSRTRCYSNETVLEGEQRDFVRINARVTGTDELLTNYTNTYYTGLNNATAQMRVNHYINNKNADTPSQAVNVGTQPASVFFSVENTGEIELYRVRAYQDPVSPVNSGWAEQCKIGPIKPGQTRYCRRDITLPNAGLNHVVGRAQGVNAFVTPTGVINAENPTYFNKQ